MKDLYYGCKDLDGFKHDRVLQRMIKEEFKSTQAFMYPDEYNVYDQTKEACMKKFNSKQ